MGQYLQNACKRLESIEFDSLKISSRMSDIMLVKEYIRRAAIIQTTYSSVRMPYPYFDLANSLEIDTQELNIIETFPKVANISNAYVKVIVTAYLKLSYLIEKQNPIAVKYNDLYEPLIILFEKGGLMGRDHGSITAGGCVMPLFAPDYMAAVDSIDISDNALENYEKNLRENSTM